jgi:hypothetical protein
MRRPSPFAATCVWGVVCGAVLGAVRTRGEALHLLAKGRALEALGVPSLPGPSQWTVLSSWRPAGAGALFFGLSLGLGAGALAALFVAATRRSDLPLARHAGWVVLLPAVWAGLARDWGLAGMLAFTSLGAVASAAGTPRPAARDLALRLFCAAVAALGLVPWLLAPEGAFTRLRDRWLLSGPGLALDEFYYRWTLYPAEALKPLAARTQPVANVGDLGPTMARAFAAEALPLHVLGLSVPPDGADLAVEARNGTAELVAGSARVAWPRSGPERLQAWRRLSREADGGAPLRSATAAALFFGCPLGLAWALGAGCAWIAGRLAPDSTRAPFVLAGLLAAWLALAGAPSKGTRFLQALRQPQGIEVVRRTLSSDSPVLRFYGARAAGSLGPAAEPLLLAALRDPVINVRYAAAQNLGAMGGGGGETALVALLRGPEEWYVKERAYAALWRLGWRPPIQGP